MSLPHIQIDELSLVYLPSPHRQLLELHTAATGCTPSPPPILTLSILYVTDVAIDCVYIYVSGVVFSVVVIRVA